MNDQSRSSVKKINTMKVRQGLGEILNEVYYRGDTFIVERDGKPLAALVPLSVLEDSQKKAARRRLSMTHKKETNVNHIKDDHEAYY